MEPGALQHEEVGEMGETNNGDGAGEVRKGREKPSQGGAPEGE